MITKKDITDKVNTLKKLGMKIVISQTDRKKRKQEADLPDYFISGRGYLIYLECKIGSDKATDGQIELMNNLKEAQAKNNRVYADFITDIDFVTKINFLTNAISNFNNIK